MSLGGRALRLGTRRSLLARAQSGWVARELERANPGVTVELVGIDTRGDKILDVPLQSVEGKEFFVAELDDALRSRAVDFCVHSMKDLSLERPAEFSLAAVPPRENPRDVVIFGPGAEARLKAGRALRIGTSSPRRLENLPPFLERAVPRFGAVPRFDWVEIRGNVNTRLGRVHAPEGDERYLDGVVLALAGLNRLFADESGRAELSKLLAGVRWMVLPLRECPTAPGQGALAIECRREDRETAAFLGKIHDPAGAARAARERARLAEWGGGCHQRFGATAIEHEELGPMLYVRGRKPDGEFVDTQEWAPVRPAPRPASGSERRLWDGMEWRARQAESAQPSSEPGRPGSRLPAFAVAAPVFVAHARALPSQGESVLSAARVWVSGSASWFKLAERGIWVEGSAEGLGYEELARGLRQLAVLGLPAGDAGWTVLTHEGAASSWGPGIQVIATYRTLAGTAWTTECLEALRDASDVFWGSSAQYDALIGNLAQGARQACGPGRTARHLRGQGVAPMIFPSTSEWKRWLGVS